MPTGTRPPTRSASSRSSSPAAAGGVMASAEEIIDEARNGRMFILVDDEDRENEGDLVIPAQMATPDAINFMAKHGRGLICLALTKERVDQLGLQPMSRDQRHPARDRLHHLDRGARGRHHRHLRRRPRAHHLGRDRRRQGRPSISSRPATSSRWSRATAACWSAPAIPRRRSTSSRLAGLNPSGVICEIMTRGRHDGADGRSRSPSPSSTASRSARSATSSPIACSKDHLVEQTAEARFESRWGGDLDGADLPQQGARASSRSRWSRARSIPAKPTLVRMHALSIVRRRLRRGGRARRPARRGDEGDRARKAPA